MKRGQALVCAACVLLGARAAWAHRIDEYLQATMVTLGAHEVQASMRLIPGVRTAPEVIEAIDTDRDGVFSASEQRAYAERVVGDLAITADGKRVMPVLQSWEFPAPGQMREGLGEIRLAYAAPLPRGGAQRALVLENHHWENHHRSAASVYLVNAVVPEDNGIRIVAQKRNEMQTVYELDYEQAATAASTSHGLQVWLSGAAFESLFRLGMRHIAEGTDHLLFLLALLLPAPLLAAGSRWKQAAGMRQSLLRILSIVTAFTVGHSITLSLAAMRVVHVAERPVEVLIAASILVSAVHAWRPLFPGREAWIAGFFGLIHGLAFATTLDRLGLASWERVGGVLAFNLGIEAMQMLVVAAILPSLLLLSRTRVYPVVRVGGAAFAGAASAGWIVERLTGLHGPVDSIVDAVGRHAAWGAGVLFAVSLVCRYGPVGHLPARLIEGAGWRRAKALCEF